MKQKMALITSGILIIIGLVLPVKIGLYFLFTSLGMWIAFGFLITDWKRK